MSERERERGRGGLPSDARRTEFHHTPAVVDVTALYLSGRGVPVVEVLLVGVHPNLRRPDGVLEEVGPCVRSLFRKNVAHVRAGMDLQAAPTLPHLLNEKQFLK